MRFTLRPAHQRGLPAKAIAEAAEQRLRNAREIGAIREREKWEKACRRLLSDWQTRREAGFPGTYEQSALALEEVVDELAGKGA